MKLKTKLLIAALVGVVAWSFCISKYHTDQRLAAEKRQAEIIANTPFAHDINLWDLYSLTNQDRQKAGVVPLNINVNLNKSAQAKCNDMVARNYYDHVDPSGAKWTAILEKYVPYYGGADENIDVNVVKKNAAEINDIFMNSQVHRDGILNPDYNSVGFGVCDGLYQGNKAVFVVEHFIKEQPQVNIQRDTSPRPVVCDSVTAPGMTPFCYTGP